MKINIEGSCVPTTSVRLLNYGALFETQGCYYVRTEAFKGVNVVTGAIVKFQPEAQVIHYPDASVRLGNAS